MKYMKNKYGDKNGTPISFWSTDDNVLCEDGKTLRENLDKVDTQFKDIANEYLGGKKIVYCTNAQYEKLKAGEAVTINNKQYTYDAENTVYNITDSEIEINSNNILTSPNGSKFKLKISDDGILSTEKIINLIISDNNLTVNEGGSVTFTVKLKEAKNEIINITVDNENCTVSPISLSFTTDNYNAPQTVTITGKRDSSFDNKNSIITISSSSETTTINITIQNTDVDVSNFVNYAYNTDTYTNPSTTELVNKSTYYLAYNVDKNISNGILTITKKSSVEAGSNAYFLNKLSVGDNNKYYVRVMAKTIFENIQVGSSTSANVGILDLEKDGDWHLMSYVYDDINTTSNHLKIYMIDAIANATVELKEIMKINLTELYGAGNEPDKATCDSIFTTYKTGLVG